MPRLFTGLEVPSDIALELDLMKGGIEGARWIDAGSYHITLRFIGDVSGSMAADVDDALARVHPQPFDIRLSGMGFFGGPSPRSLHASVEPNQALSALQASHERACQMAGLAPEGRRYTPHVTIARFKSAASTDISDFISRHNLFVSRPFTVTRFVLFSARPGRGGGPYVPERVYDLD
jgi:2'-5' RNA ligase